MAWQSNEYLTLTFNKTKPCVCDCSQLDALNLIYLDIAQWYTEPLLTHFIIAKTSVMVLLVVSDLKRTWSAFLFYTLVLLMTSFATASLGLLCGLLTRIYSVAHALTSFTLLVSVVRKLHERNIEIRIYNLYI